MRLAGGSPQTCRQCVFRVMAKSETDHCCKVSFCILDKAQRDLFLGKEGSAESGRWVSPTYFYPGSGEKVESRGMGAQLPSLTPHEEVLQDGLFVELGLRRK